MVPYYLSYKIKVCAAPKSVGFETFWSENGYGLFWSEDLKMGMNFKCRV